MKLIALILKKIIKKILEKSLPENYPLIEIYQIMFLQKKSKHRLNFTIIKFLKDNSKEYSIKNKMKSKKSFLKKKLKKIGTLKPNLHMLKLNFLQFLEKKIQQYKI
jgi:hypothetical protein